MDLHLLLAALIVFAAYTVFGVTGFGVSPITVPVLAHFLPLPFVLSLAAALDLGSAAALGVHTKKQADVRELLVLAPFTIIGLALGVTLLVSLPRDATLLALGVFVCGYALYSSASPAAFPTLRRNARRSRRWSSSTWDCASLRSPSQDSSPAAICGSRSGCFFRSRGRASGPGIGCRGAWRRRRSCVSSVRCSSSAACR